MDLSGLIFVVLALAWAGYLMPRALRQHDDLESSAPVDTSSDTARVLNRTPAMMRALLADNPPLDPEQKAADRVALKDSESRRRAALTRSRPTSRGAAVRRRRILLGLVVLTLLSIGAASLSYLSWWTVAAPAALVATWLVLCSLMARKSRLAARGRVRFSVADRLTDADEVPLEGAVPAVPASPIVEQLVAEVHHDVETRHIADAGVELDAAQGALWDPLPLTLPTYVGKPTARRTVRTIELTQGGFTSSGHDPADTALARRAAESQKPDQAPAQGSADPVSESEVRRAAGA